jgi:UDP-N-acetylmuramyl pentapeptide phosphotransferase/UDP-N-acetylglucosamine-1-phosphate transferase
MLTAIFLAAGLSLCISFVACRLVIAGGLMDAPTIARKMHAKPVPTSGGIAMGLAFALGILAVWASGGPEVQTCCTLEGRRLMALACGAVAAFTAIGFLDDVAPLGPRGKLAMFLLGALITALAAGPVPVLSFGLGATLELPFVAALLGAMLWVFVTVNVVNFMDGANGLAMGSTAIGLIALASSALLADVNSVAILSLCGAGALIGFLFWNFPRARLFAGDSGALFAGSLAALCSLAAVRRGVAPIVPFLCFLPMFADALLTFAWRAAKKRNLLNGHAEHIYQIGLRSGLGHTRVTLAYWAAALHCGIVAVITSQVELGAAAAALAEPDPMKAALARAATFTPLVALILLIAVFMKAFFAVRAYAEARNMSEVDEV